MDIEKVRALLLTKRDRLQQGISKLSVNLEQVRGALSITEELLKDLDVLEKQTCTDVQEQQTDGVDQRA